jgi:hypothetical protein
MHRIVIYAAAIAAVTAWAQIGTARAQQTDSDRRAGSADPGQSMTTVVPQPRADVLGVPLGINAPVAHPYADSAYRNFAGQPATGNSNLAAGFGPRD